MTTDSSDHLPERWHATPASPRTQHALQRFRHRARLLAAAARQALDTPQPAIERAVREAIARAQQAVIAGATTARPYAGRVTHHIARRLDPDAATDDRYEQALRELVDAIGDPGSITYSATRSGYVLESGPDAGRMTSGIAYDARLSDALAHARDVLHVHTAGARHGEAPPADLAANAERSPRP